MYSYVNICIHFSLKKVVNYKQGDFMSEMFLDSKIVGDAIAYFRKKKSRTRRGRTDDKKYDRLR